MNDPQAAVWKYELQPGITGLWVPVGSEFLTVAAQGGGIYVWALGITQRPSEHRTILTVGTGHEHNPATLGRYIGTAFLDGLVFHAFESGDNS